VEGAIAKTAGDRIDPPPGRLQSISAAAAAATEPTASATATTTAAAVSTAAAVATASAATTTAATATGAVFAGLGFINGESAAVMFLAVQRGNGCRCFRIASHLNETEALAAAGFAVADDFGRLHGAVLAEKLLKVRAVCIVAQVPNV
jgi:hypothetical protein